VNRCGSCLHLKSTNSNGMGRCRKNPPQYYTEHGNNDNSNYTDSDYMWVGENMIACGQFEKKPICMNDRDKSNYTISGVKVTEISSSKKLGFKAMHRED